MIIHATLHSGLVNMLHFYLLTSQVIIHVHVVQCGFICSFYILGVNINWKKYMILFGHIGVINYCFWRVLFKHQLYSKKKLTMFSLDALVFVRVKAKLGIDTR